jgi:hypothetical protein
MDFLFVLIDFRWIFPINEHFGDRISIQFHRNLAGFRISA